MTKAFRFALAVDVDMTVEGFLRPIEATVLDLSLGGCRIATSSILLTGSAVDFVLPLAKRGSVRMRGKVRHAAPGGQPGRLEIGIEFAPLPPKDAATLTAFIEEGRAGDAEGQSSIRVETELPVLCSLAGKKETCEALALDLGRGGMRIALDRQLPTASMVNLQFTLLDSSGIQLDVKMRAKVVGCSKVLREFQHNVVFLDVTPAMGDAIARFVRAKQLEEMRSGL
jgi:c-di-GMP-binding flagellar brake protein YcgR